MENLSSVSLGACVNQSVQESRPQRKPARIDGILATAGLTIHEETTTGKAVAAKTCKRQTVSEIHELLTRCGLAIHDETSEHC